MRPKIRDRAHDDPSLAIQHCFKHPRISNHRLKSITSMMHKKLKERFGMIFLEFIHIGIDKMKIIKLRKTCQEFQKEQSAGEVLLHHAVNGVLHQIPNDIKNIEWVKYIKQYISNNFQLTKNKIVATERKMNEEETFRMFFNIMHQHDQIMNPEEEKSENDDAFNLRQLLSFIDDTFTMSKLMDTMFNLRSDQKNMKNSTKITNQHPCKFGYNCKILLNDVKARKYQVLSRTITSTDKSNTKYKDEEYSKLELLNLIHVVVFHEEESNRRRLRDTDILEKTNLFQDELGCFDNLLSFKTFCKHEEYDSDAIYDDLFPDNDTQSNIYNLFNNDKYMTDMYYSIKKAMFNYTINPLDKQAVKRNLIELDFGDHVVNWNVDAKFLNMKQEWFQNEFFQVNDDLYNSLYLKSKIIADTVKNRKSYNLSNGDVLCIKMYTDTNALQANFRHAFRMSATKSRRSQFIHWATNLHIVFIKVEIANDCKGANEFICNVTLYHGLNRLFDTKGLAHQFHGLLSTTWEESVATSFAGDAGMILTIDKGINNKNVNAIEVDWISCHATEQEVLLLNPKVLIQESTIFLDDPELQSAYLKSVLLTTLSEDTDAFKNLSAFFKSRWVESCLAKTMQDAAFIERIKLFQPQQYLNGMSVFQFIFFECNHYQIADYVNEYQYRSKKEIFEMIFGRLETDFFSIHDDWIEGIDRSQQVCSKYQPRMCKMNIMYEYGDTDKTSKPFGTKQGKQMLINMNLILQHIDQRKLRKLKNGVIIHINMEIKYQYMTNNGNKSNMRIWRHKLLDFKFQLGNTFKWKITHDTTLSCQSMYVSSLWMTNQSTITAVDINEIHSNNEQFNLFCENNVIIDEKSAINVEKHIMISCNHLTIKGEIDYGRSVLIVTNRTNISAQTFEFYTNVKFGFIVKSNKSMDRILYTDRFIAMMPTVHDKFVESDCKAELFPLVVDSKSNDENVVLVIKTANEARTITIEK
eukprot:307837_1